jgi:hypothetical protein
MNILRKIVYQAAFIYKTVLFCLNILENLRITEKYIGHILCHIYWQLSKDIFFALVNTQ